MKAGQCSITLFQLKRMIRETNQKLSDFEENFNIFACFIHELRSLNSVDEGIFNLYQATFADVRNEACKSYNEWLRSFAGVQPLYSDWLRSRKSPPPRWLLLNEDIYADIYDVESELVDMERQCMDILGLVEYGDSYVDDTSVDDDYDEVTVLYDTEFLLPVKEQGYKLIDNSTNLQSSSIFLVNRAVEEGVKFLKLYSDMYLHHDELSTIIMIDKEYLQYIESNFIDFQRKLRKSCLCFMEALSLLEPEFKNWKNTDEEPKDWLTFQFIRLRGIFYDFSFTRQEIKKILRACRRKLKKLKRNIKRHKVM